MTSRTVAIVDTGVANVGSVCNCLKQLGVEHSLTRDPALIKAADRVIIPGVGSFDAAMKTLETAGLPDTLRRLKQPVLGICLGMQLLGEGSEEGQKAGLGIVPMHARRIKADAQTHVPHMGWNTVAVAQPDCRLLDGLGEDAWFYFANSYCQPVGPNTAGITEHGGPFTSVVHAGNFYGVQFHPEKSGALGKRLMANFLELQA